MLNDPTAAARATIVELAERSGTSPATVTRFCRALGFDGYADLRLGIAGETGRAARSAGWTVDIGREIQTTDPLDRVHGQIMAADTMAMRDTAGLLDLGDVARTTDAIAGASRVDIYGAGGSALMGEEMQFALHRMGAPAWAWTDIHNGLASAALLRTNDVAIGISHSGPDPGDDRDDRRGRCPRRHHGRADQLSRLAVGRPADLTLLTATQATTFRPDALSARHPAGRARSAHIAVAQRRERDTVREGGGAAG